MVSPNKLDKFIRWLFPHAEMVNDHPLYRVEKHSLRRRTLTGLIAFTRLWAMGVMLPVFLFWLAMVIDGTIKDMNDPNNYGYFYRASSISGQFVGWIAFAALLAAGLLDFAAMLISVGSINREKISGNWDLIRLTNLDERNIIITKHTLAQLRVWRLLVIIISLRWTAFILFWLTFIIIPNGTSSDVVDFFRYTFPDHPLEVTLYGVCFFMVSYLYLIEPLWRLRTSTAIGLYVSDRVRSVVFSVLAGFGSIVLMWISQAVILGAILWGSLSIASRTVFRYDYDISSFLIAVLSILYVAFLCYLIRGYYRLIQRWCFTRTLRNAFHEA